MKDPAFLFYSGDFMNGVADLTMEERGQYITLLCLQHQKGHLTEKMISLCVGNAKPDVLAKFSQDSGGCYYNERLEQEILKRKEYSEKQRKNAKNGWSKRVGNAKPSSLASGLAMPTEDEDENINQGIEIGGVGEREKGETEDETFIRKLFLAMFNQMPDLYQRTTTENLIKQFGKEKVREAFLKSRDAGLITFKKNYILAILNNQENDEKGSTITGIQYSGNNGGGRAQNIPQRQYRGIKTDDEIRADLAKVYGKNSA